VFPSLTNPVSGQTHFERQFSVRAAGRRIWIGVFGPWRGVSSCAQGTVAG